jgi:hypothetical protein
MSNRFTRRRGRRAGIAVAALLALGIVPAGAQAAAINLATVNPFVVLGGSTVTNTGPSVLNGNLGLAPGTSLTGFGLPAVVNGATHNNDGVAAQAQADLGTAFGVASGQPIPPGNELTGIDLGGLTLTPGAYGYSSSAQLTGQLTLDAQGDPNAQFVFVIGSTLTTASASSVNMINGASPCNVFWKVGSSATLGSTTAFQGNLMAQTDISLNNGVTVLGRVLALNGQISLINDVLSSPQCETASTPTETEPTQTAPPISSPPVPAPATGTTGTTTRTPPRTEKAHGPGRGTTPDTRNGTATVQHGAQGPNGTSVTVRGHAVSGITVSVDHKKVDSSGASSMHTTVTGTPGTHTVTVHVTFKDKTPDKFVKFKIHVPSAAPLHPRHGPSQFTG